MRIRPKSMTPARRMAAVAMMIFLIMTMILHLGVLRDGEGDILRTYPKTGFNPGQSTIIPSFSDRLLVIRRWREDLGKKLATVSRGRLPTASPLHRHPKLLHHDPKHIRIRHRRAVGQDRLRGHKHGVLRGIDRGAPCEPRISVASNGMLRVAMSTCNSTGS